MNNLNLSLISFFKSNQLLIRLVVIIFTLFINFQVLYSQAVYVDSNTGNDDNTGTEDAPVFSIQKAIEIVKSQNNDIYMIKINAGMYVLDSPVSVSTDKDMTDKRIVIAASVLPGDPLWKPEKMPVVFSISKKGEVPGQDYHFVVGFLINESHVTIRGLKFPGYFYPNTRYFPIARFNKTKTDLFVEQCLFVGNEDASHLQVGIMAHGNQIRADHCVFYNVRNSVVFWQDAGDGIKSGNGITNSIIFGATQSGVWTAWPDNDFIFKNNIISDCKYAWIKNYDNPTIYSIDSCIIVNNQYYQGIAGNTISPQEFEVIENNVIKEGEISLRPKNEVIHYDLPIDYLHIIPNTLGYDMGAGLFKNNVTDVNMGKLEIPENSTLYQNYPNPFNATTVIRYQLLKSGFTKLIIYNSDGQEIETLINKYQQTGDHQVTWKAEGIASGIYFYKLYVTDHVISSSQLSLERAGHQFLETKKLILLK